MGVRAEVKNNSDLPADVEHSAEKFGISEHRSPVQLPSTAALVTELHNIAQLVVTPRLADRCDLVTVFFSRNLAEYPP